MDHIPPPLQQHAQPTATATPSPASPPQSASHSSSPPAAVVSSSSIPPPGQTPTSLAYRTKQLGSALADWLWRPFIQGLAFGLGTHLSLYTYQRLWLRQTPQLPFIANIAPHKNNRATSSATGSTSANSSSGTRPSDESYLARETTAA